MITLTLIIILIITGIAWLMRKIFKVAICPICAGVSGMWILILLGRNSGLLVGDWNVMLAMLTGGSVVGIAYQLEKKIALVRPSLGALWKAVFIPIGFLTAYALIMSWWLEFALSGAFLGLLFWVFSKGAAGKAHHEVQPDQKVEELKKQMDKCC